MVEQHELSQELKDKVLSIFAANMTDGGTPTTTVGEFLDNEWKITVNFDAGSWQGVKKYKAVQVDNKWKVSDNDEIRWGNGKALNENKDYD